MRTTNQPIGTILAVLMVSFASAAYAQFSPPPTPLNQGTQPGIFSGEAQKNNLIMVGLSASTTYDDNADNVNRLSNVMSSFSGDFKLNLLRPRWNLLLGYTPGYSYNTEITRYNEFSQAQMFSLQYRMSPRLSLSLRNQFSRISNPQQSITTGGEPPLFGAVEGTNPTGVGQNLIRTSEQAGVDVTYQLDARSFAGVGGGYAIVQSKAPGASILLQDSLTPSANAFYSRKITSTQTSGVQYRWQRIDAQGGVVRTTAHTILLFHSVNLPHHVTVSVFGGPEGTETLRVVGPTSVANPLTWSWSAGGNFDWRGVRNAINAGVVRQVNDAGTLGGVVRLTNLNAGFNRRLTARSTIHMGVSYARNRAFDLLVSPGATGDYVIGSAEYQHTLGRHIGFSLSYSHVEQTKAATLPSVVQGDHNRVAIALSYSFERPIGR
ncbi:MAG TPA: hypothetical protein VFA60_08970 [Terriglobales bacterium]|nr:hypothetical protein [Terriglobales bacterium]